MSDQPPTSHELFHDVTDSRPRAGRAAGGTLAVSIVAHALILAAVIVVPLLATDALPDVVDTIRFRVEPLPPPEPPPRPSPAHLRQRSRRSGIRGPSSLQTRSSTSRLLAGRVCELCRRSEGGDRGLRTRRRDRSRGAAAPPPPPCRRSRRATALNMPTKVHDVAPIYPTIARQAGVEGMVIIEAVIAVDGTVRDARVLRSVTLLDHAALDAVKQALRADAPQRRRGPGDRDGDRHFALQR